jgi:hypothetical protein
MPEHAILPAMLIRITMHNGKGGGPGCGRFQSYLAGEYLTSSEKTGEHQNR